MKSKKPKKSFTELVGIMKGYQSMLSTITEMTLEQKTLWEAHNKNKLGRFNAPPVDDIHKTLKPRKVVTK